MHVCSGTHQRWAVHCRYHYSFNTGLQSQSVLYSQAGIDSKETVLLDPNKLSKDGTV